MGDIKIFLSYLCVLVQDLISANKKEMYIHGFKYFFIKFSELLFYT